MRIADIYHSIQGEGFLTGTPSVFVRASGCNLRCQFCDTPHASWYPEGEDLSIPDIARQVQHWETRHVVITGGEPMLYAELIPLCQQLRRWGRHVTIETAGTLLLPVDCDLMSISPKLSNSYPGSQPNARWRRRHQRTRHAPDVIRKLVQRTAYQIKFVVDQPADLQEIDQYLGQFPQIDRQRVLLMPQGTEPESLDRIAQWLSPYCQQHGLHFCPRKQVEWFGGLVRRT
jgi:7-carboxy-7-deazaguanine synthase